MASQKNKKLQLLSKPLRDALTAVSKMQQDQNPKVKEDEDLVIAMIKGVKHRAVRN